LTEFLGNTLEKGAKAKDAIGALLAAAPPDGTLFLRDAFESYDSSTTWWFGVRPAQGGALEALACVQGTFTSLYAGSNEAATALGTHLARVSRGSRDGKEHHVLGPKKVVDRFFQAFQIVGRDIVHDRQQVLLGTTEPSPLTSPRITAAMATAVDEAVLYEFLGEQSVEQFGRDPRRLSKDGHRKFCQALTEAARVVVGRQGPSPLLVAEFVPICGATLIERLYYPKPFRRAKLMGRGLGAVLGVARTRTEEALFFADSHRSYQREVADLCGFTERETYRLLVLR
jgi:hypothetical protein